MNERAEGSCHEPVLSMYMKCGGCVGYCSTVSDLPYVLLA